MSGLLLLLSATALFLAMTPEAFNGGLGSETEQPVSRFFTFVTIAIVAPWVSIAQPHAARGDKRSPGHRGVAAVLPLDRTVDDSEARSPRLASERVQTSPAGDRSGLAQGACVDVSGGDL